jgi:hypothetical protein
MDAYRGIRKSCIKSSKNLANVSCRPMEPHFRLSIQAVVSSLLVHKDTSTTLHKLQTMNFPSCHSKECTILRIGVVDHELD